MIYYKRVSHLMPRGTFFSLVKETRLRRVGRYYSLQLNAKAKSMSNLVLAFLRLDRLFSFSGM